MSEPTPRRLWPLGPLPLVLPAAEIAAAVLMGVWGMLTWPYQEWVRTSAEFHQQLAFAGPIAAASATYLAGRLTAPDRVFALPVAPRAGRATALRLLGLLGTSCTIGYLIGLIPLVAVTASDAEHGAPHPLPVLTGVLGLWAAIAIGHLVGVLGRTALWAPLTCACAFAAVVAGTGGDELSALLPVLHVSPIAGRVESTPFVVYRIAFFTVIAAASVVAAVAVSRLHRVGRRPLRALTPLLVPVLLAGPALVSTPALFSLERDAPRVCRVERGVEHCVHAAHGSRLPIVERATAAVLDAYGAPADEVRRVYDEALRWDALVADAEAGTPGAHADVVWVVVQPASPTDHTGQEVAALLSGLNACPAGAGEGDRVDLAFALSTWLQGGPTSDGPLARLTDDELRAWITVNGERLGACALGVADLPGEP
ncbi:MULTISPECIES: hypothetical protein [Actinosynnema]|uniref:hypothetical protein n=1 Tax=Actinosynnema TaxID=40566 RepID=UPI0020A370E5|nr:hypothetical protein [Actinosynnema pretiosum]MCP2096294.1 hypothetical protein [Actinosynnema pretiosum]